MVTYLTSEPYLFIGVCWDLYKCRHHSERINLMQKCDSICGALATSSHLISALFQVDRDAVQRLAKFGARHAVRFNTPLRKVVFDKFVCIQTGVHQFPLKGTSAIHSSLALPTASIRS